ncbi:MAG: pyridoxal phosphate-dependent aminotransferase [Chloroflexi bacterium]|nr:pyridoxal phosphate-dependent aminotransferase [Chloroflexota bacterium]
MKYDFDTVCDRYNTHCAKWDFAEQSFKVKGILPMSVGDMDFRTPQEIIDAIKKMADHGIFGYSVVPDSYYEALAEWQRKRHGWDIQKEWVVLCPGVVPSIRLLVKAFTQPGDQVIVQSPVYPPFFNVVRDNGCEVIDSPLRVENGKYVMDLVDLEKKITPRTKMMLLCSPHNPVGRVWREDELRQLGELCLERDILVVSDEIHEDIVFESCKHVPYPLASGKFAERSIVCTSASKTFNLAGLKTSNTIIPDENLRKQFTAIARASAMPSPNTFGVIAAEAAYRYGEPWLEQLLDYLEGNITFLKQYASEKIPGLRIIEPEGTYFVLLDFNRCGINPGKLSTFVREDAKVGLQAGTHFGYLQEGFERMNIACARSIVAEGLKRLEKTVNELGKC